MGSIKPLPEAVRSSVRSGIILYDLTRVVEELVFNSLDAGATKVHVAVGVGTSFIKVLDNGSGIGRDGLALLGERYATSSYESFVGLDSGGTFGFRGEALCSIADVSLLEVTTKTHGMPHGYRKIMKGRKCLYIGIDDDRRDVGTTVIVRDLFYNQPVRRKHMLSSPKKVLHSIKKCMLRIALVQSRVSFRVADIESDDELLSTSASPSPLQLLSSNFGIEASSSLNELKASEGGLKLSGYISSPFGILSLKVFQYIYINSRFVCKGPIHKMLNQLAVGSWGNGKYNNESQYEKRSRLQTCPSFILNLSCPRSLYDITFEPSKNLVEFREWGPILTFVQNAVTRIWAESFSDDLPVNCEVGKKRCRTQKWQASLDDCKTLPAWRKSQSCEKSNAEASELEKYHIESLHVRDTDNAVALDSSSCGLEKYTESNPDMQFYDNFLSMEEKFSGNDYAADKSNKQVDYFLGLRWQNESFKEDDSTRYMSMGSAVSTDCHRITNHADVNQEFSKVHQLNCFRRGSLLHHGPSFRSELEIQFASDDFTMQKEWVDNDEDIGIGEEDGVNHLLKDTYSQQAEVKPVWSFSKCTNSHKARLNPNFSLRYMKSPLIAGECSGEEKDLLHYSRKDVNHCSLDLHSSTTDWTPLASGCLFDTTIADIDNLIGENNLETQFECRKGTKYTHFPDGEEDCNFSLDMAVDSWDQNCSISRYADFTLNQELNAGSWRERGKFSRRKFEGSFSPSCSKIFADEEDCGHLHISCQDKLLDSSDQPNHPPVSAQSNRMKYRGIQVGNQDNVRPHKKMSRRGHSAPPFHKHRKKFLVLNDSLKMATTINNDFLLPETRSLNHPKHCSETSKMNYRKQLFNSPRSSSMSNYVDDSFSVAVLDMKRTPEPLQVQNRELKEQGKFIHDSVKGFAPKEVEDILDSRQKWHNHCPETERGVRLHNVENQDAILDISSGILHLAGDSLVPSSIDKNSLKVARVLQQVDKKFIPIIAGRTLAIIDQHAADERIRLEELRQKVLSGEMKQITHLEAEQELVLPEIGYQLLHNYSEQIQNWGWICNFNTQGSRPFTKSLNVLHRQPTIAKLLAVPCILGVILTDLDLLEFLQQLADTDGSSTIPPSVHRVLNNKACRGAIMFGDTLLPSECSLIVEELKQTSLCFQCAHGRPTTVPLVNLDALHKHINELGLCSSGTNGSWHGLRRHEISLNRAASRLSSAID